MEETAGPVLAKFKIEQGSLSKMDHKQSKLANFESHWQIVLQIGMGLFSIVLVYRRADQ
jgi:hypothetical protein